MLEFTENQKKTMTSALAVLSFAVMLAFFLFLAWALLKLLAFASSAVVPLALGFFLSLFFKPWYRWWLARVKNPTLAVIVMLSTILVPLGFLGWYAGAVAVDEVVNLVRQGPELIRQVVAWFHLTFPKLQTLLEQIGLSYDRIGKAVGSAGGAAIIAGTTALKGLSFVISLLVTLIFFVFFLTAKDYDGEDIVGAVPFLKDETRAFIAEQIDSFLEILVGFFRRQAVICLLEGLYYGAGFWLVGLPYGFLIGFSMGVMNLIPLFGSVICLPVALALAYFPAGGSTARLTMVASVWALGQLLDGYFITPKIQGDRTGLGYAGVIFSFFFWATVLGPVLGMLLAIPLSAFCVVLGRALKKRYIKPVV